MKTKVDTQSKAPVFDIKKVTEFPVLVSNGTQYILIVSKTEGVILHDDDDEDNIQILSKYDMSDDWDDFFITDCPVSITFEN